MSNNIAKQKWKTVEYSRSQIISAGKKIRNPLATEEDILSATKIIDNWRAAHAFPLHVIYEHLRRIAGPNSDIIVAQRLKRLPSIIQKLKREFNMNLWTMQDLGGCRVIVPKIDDVYDFANNYENSKKRHIKIKENDYIKNPKVTGYRSLHIVYKYNSGRNDTYNNNMLIEIQFRTRLQHLWATAVETMDIFTSEAIKSGAGSPDATRFFVLISALFSIIERKPIVPNVINDFNEIVSEIKMLDAKHNYLDLLNGKRRATVIQEQHTEFYRDGYSMLILDYVQKKLYIRSFKSSQIDLANDFYNQLEETRNSSSTDIVLVRVSSFNNLRSAYPNYFSDIAEFIATVKINLLSKEQ